MIRRMMGVLLLGYLLVGCSMTKVKVDAAMLGAAPPPAQKLACGYRLGSLVDARPTNASAGMMGTKAFELPDALGIVRSQLAASGLQEGGDGRVVDIRLMQMYLSQNTITLVPVVVYEATVEGERAFVLRGQPASMNDWGSTREAMQAYAAALQAANGKLVALLNAACSQV
jgi:hypothetical protein